MPATAACQGLSGDPVRRGLAYLSALMLAVAGIAPWVTMRGAMGGASPAGVATVLLLALAVVLATLLRRRFVVRLVGVLTAAFAVYVVWLAPDELLVANLDAPRSPGRVPGCARSCSPPCWPSRRPALPAPAVRRRREPEQPAPGEPS